MRTIRVWMENGDSITTRIKATEDKVKQYYLGQSYIYENPETGEETKTRFVRVEFLDEEKYMVKGFKEYDK